MTHPVAACTNPHLLCHLHDHPFYPQHAIHQEETMGRIFSKGDRVVALNGDGSLSHGTVADATKPNCITTEQDVDILFDGETRVGDYDRFGSWTIAHER